LDAGLIANEDAINGSAAEWSMLSFFGRMTYNYKEKYLFEANLRYDGSSRFPEGNKWGMFPSFSVGWRANEEEFLKDYKWLDNLKLRASWGKLGNQNIGNYPYQRTYTLGIDYLFGTSKMQGLASTKEVDDKIKWETTTTTDVGLDLTIFEKLNFTADYFIRLTDDILVAMDIPATLGGKNSPVVNLAMVQNKGWELAASYKDFIGDFSWNAGVNVTRVDNEVIKYFGEVRSGGDFIVTEGYPYLSMYGYVANDLIRSQEQLDQLNAKARELSGDPSAWYINNATAPGDILYEDLDGNGIIDSNDRQVIGNTIPRFTYGLNLGAAYKGFYFSALFQGLSNYSGYVSGEFVFPMNVNLDRGYITQDWADNHWSAENPDNSTLPRLIAKDKYSLNYSYFSSFWQHDLSFIRLKSVQFGYNLPKSVLNKLSLTQARIYFNGENMLTFSKYKAWDPERSQDATGVPYPNIKTMNIGVQVSF
jgi:TonB-linked SusC/RagA family outer membrane protein